MSSIMSNPGSWCTTSRSGAVLLAPVSDVVLATGLSSAASVAADLGFVPAVVGAAQAAEQATPRTHKYINRPGSPPRGTR